MGRWLKVLFGDLPYMPCYAAGGNKLQFAAVPKKGGQVTRVSEELDLDKGADRIRALQIGVNMFRLLKLLVPCLPDTHVALGETVRRANGVSITVTASGVYKRIEDFDSHFPRQDIELLKRVYAAADKEAHLVHAAPGYPSIKRRASEGLVYQVLLCPVGYHAAPTTDLDLACCITCVLRALHALHREGFVHRDIRMENVLCLGDNEWMLADLESAASLPVTDTFASRVWTDGGMQAVVGSAYTLQSDLQQVGLLIRRSSVVSHSALSFADKLLNGTFADAQAALEHEWLLQSQSEAGIRR